VRSIDLEQKLRIAHNNIALQGELIGEGIRGNPYKLKGQQFFVYDIYDIDRGVYFNAFIRATLVRDFGLNHAPFEYTNFVFPNDITVGSLLKLAEGKSALNSSTEREGLVFKCIEDPSISFKVISNRFLLREK
jgi:ATP-dependent RNA circularization protein (DNA/RNA ligase family)